MDFEVYVNGKLGPIDIDLKLAFTMDLSNAMDVVVKMMEEAFMESLKFVEKAWKIVEAALTPAKNALVNSVTKFVDDMKLVASNSLKLMHCHGGLNIGWCKCGPKWQGGNGHLRWSCPRYWEKVCNCGTRKTGTVRLYDAFYNCGWHRSHQS